MAGSRKNADAALIAALAGGKTVQAAAQLTEVSERTIYRRLDDPDFRQQLQQARADMLDRALGHLSAGSAEAAIVLRNIVAEGKPADRVRVSAAKAVLELGSRLRENVELAEQIEDIKRRLKKRGM